jgi:enolase-phosphatase E1
VIAFGGRGILLDIEGTTSSVSFVYDVMFPFVRRELVTFLREHGTEPPVIGALEITAQDLGHASLEAWRAASGSDVEALAADVFGLMDGDVKATGLKQLQGLVWEAGFASGELQAHMYDDVPPALLAWNASGVDVRIYSSGSIQAQKLFFGHTIVGDLRARLRGHYDTTTGPKKESASYTRIAAEFDLPPAEVLFLSDVPAELAAARAAGMQTALVKRPGNAEVPSDHGHSVIHSFAEIEHIP